MRIAQNTCQAALFALAANLSPLPATAQDADRQLGTVQFQTSCNEVAQRRFDRAMRYQHSFWYHQARDVFEEAAKADPQCGIAHWGVALSRLDNPHGAIPAGNLAPGLAAIRKAEEIGARTDREREFIAALARMYVDHDKIPHRTRVTSYYEAMTAMAARYPKDDEVQILYAITLNVAAAPTDKTYAYQLRGAGMLEDIFKRLPDHPGVAHYLIHLYDYPPIAQKGLDAALRYSKIAPAAPHAQHMPSHIFTRVGYWKESIASNIESVKAAKADKSGSDQLHGQDYMVYAYLQLARDRDAVATADEMASSANPGPTQGADFALAASPARYAMERGDWKAAAALAVRPTKFPHAAANTHFARAIGAARSGNPQAGWADVVRLGELREQLVAAKDTYWSELVDIQWQAATAWLFLAEGKHEPALSLMRAAADAEDKTEKAPITPGPLAPARELLGTMLLERGRHVDALAAFEATMKKEPNRFRAIAGAADAAHRAGQSGRSREHYETLLKLAADGDGNRPEIGLARQRMVGK